MSSSTQEKSIDKKSLRQEMSEGMDCPFSPFISTFQCSFDTEKHKIAARIATDMIIKQRARLLWKSRQLCLVIMKMSESAPTVVRLTHKLANLIVTTALNWEKTTWINPILRMRSFSFIFVWNHQIGWQKKILKFFQHLSMTADDYQEHHHSYETCEAVVEEYARKKSIAIEWPKI